MIISEENNKEHMEVMKNKIMEALNSPGVFHVDIGYEYLPIAVVTTITIKASTPHGTLTWPQYVAKIRDNTYDKKTGEKTKAAPKTAVWLLNDETWYRVRRIQARRARLKRGKVQRKKGGWRC